VDSAANVVTVVSGLDSNATKMDQIGVNAARVWEEALQADPGATTAVIAWQGYDAPQWPEVAFEDKAAAGATLLAKDVAALAVTRRGRANVTVLGHSYGSTTASLALQREGMAKNVNQVVLTGSPGAGGHAKSARDLHLRRDQLYVASASRDPVTKLEDQLGADPAHKDFGATRVKAEHTDRDASWLNPVDDHSRYTDRSTDSESLYAVGLIVTGRSSELAAVGMLAEPRRTELQYRGPDVRMPVVIDPEAARAPTSGHVHK
jgi:pimeloyl-ACP methyl ester carboxylesterase